MRIALRKLLWGTALLPLVPAHAQGAPGTVHDEATREIVVTAQFRPQDPIDVPIALTAFDGEVLDRIGVQDFEELARFVPGLQVANESPITPGFVIRGISSGQGPAYVEPRVSVFQDGISISKARGSFVELFDVERVEVAKGPQTTLYGRSALIGAINIIQNKADPSRRSMALRSEVGNLRYVLGEGMVNLPLSENTALRLAARVRRRDGSEENLLGGQDFMSIRTEAIRGTVRIEPSERLTVDVIGNYQHDDPSGTAFVSLVKRQTDPVTGAVLAPLSPFNGVGLSSAASLEGGRPLGYDREVYGVTGLAEYRFNDALTLNSATAWRRYSALEILDVDGIPLPILSAADDGRGRQFSQDMRLRWEAGDRFTGFVGGSYFQERASQRTPAVFDERLLLAQIAGSLNGALLGRPLSDPAPLALLQDPAFSAALLRPLAGGLGVSLTGAQALAIARNLKSAHEETSTNFSRTRAWDVFADATFRPVERIEVNAGIRYSHDSKRSAITTANINGRSVLGSLLAVPGLAAADQARLFSALLSPGAATAPLPERFNFGLAGQPTPNNGDVSVARLKDGGLSFRATVRYAPNDDTSFYAGYARGRRPQELSARMPRVPGQPGRFEELLAEKVDSFEAGAKAALFDRTLLLDGAVFHYRYRNFQTTDLDGIVFVTTNAGKARSTGFEGQVRWAPSDTIELFGSYAYNHSRFRSGARRGNRLARSPDHSFAAGALLRLPVGENAVTFTPTVTYQSKVFFDDDNDRPELQPPAFPVPADVPLPPGALFDDIVQEELQKGYALVNARLGYAGPNDRWRIEAFVENLFDKEYLRDAGNTGDGLGLTTGVPGTPRTYGVSGRVSF
jgi:outer membrane receptor protein involved in Fe transport